MVKGDPTPRAVLIEGIIFWVFALLFFVGRIWSRVITNGSIKRLASDDYVMIVTFMFYTALIVLLQFNIRYASNLMPASVLAEVLKHPDEIKSRIFGSKITVAVEQCMLHAQWGAKVSLLILYHRMTQGLRINLFNKCVAAYTAFGYVFIQITFFAAWCRPFSQYWALPAANPQCANYTNHLITILVFNTSTDILMFFTPMPLIFKAQMKRRKKILLFTVFSLGVFNIIAAVLNKIYNWILPGSIVYMIWYVRESSTGIYVANATCCWPLFRTILGRASADWTNSRIYCKGEDSKPRTGGNDYGNSSRFSKLRTMGAKTMHSLHTSVSHSAFTPKSHVDSDVEAHLSSASQEAINAQQHGGAMPLEVWRQVEYDVEVGAPRTAARVPVEPYEIGVGLGGGDLIKDETGHVAVVEVGGNPGHKRGRSTGFGSLSATTGSDGDSGRSSPRLEERPRSDWR